MFLSFYGLDQQPFGVTPDPRYLFLNRSHREALASLYYAIESKRGFSALVAEPGMGKTTLLFRLLDSLKSGTRTAFLFQSHGDSGSFLRSILHDAGIGYTGLEDIPRMQQMLNQVLLEESLAGRQFVLVVDEAQNLSDELLESIRILSNCETFSAKMIHIILAGQIGLAHKLARPELVQLKQRVGSIIQLSPFTLCETSHYIYHRLHIAGYREGCPFTEEAVALIQRFSDGTPRNINNICFQALSLGFANRAQTIGVEIVAEVLSDLGLSVDIPPTVLQPRVSMLQPFDGIPESYGDSPSPSRWRVPLLGLLAVPLLFILAFRSPVVNGIVHGKVPQEAAADFAGNSNSPSNAAPASPSSSDSHGLSSPANGSAASDNIAVAVEKAVESHQEPARPSEPHKVVPAAERQTTQGDIIAEKPRVTRKPRVVVAQKPQTVFEFALEHYGTTDWIVIRGISAANPEISDPYQIIREGQRVILPEFASQLSKKFKPLSTMNAER